jgi:hypothetical protein
MAFGNIYPRKSHALFIIGDPGRHVDPSLDLVLIEEIDTRLVNVRIAAGQLLADIQKLADGQLIIGTGR